MIIMRLKGGLGNQMFQYALGRVLSIKNNTKLGLDTTFLLDRTRPSKNFTFREYNLDPFNIKAELLSKNKIPFIYRKHANGFLTYFIDYLVSKILKNKGKEKKDCFFDQSIFSISKNAYLNGYWQTYKYFEGYEEILREDFSLKNKLPEKYELIIKKMQSENSVCLHSRRGDYLKYSDFHPVLNDSYYKEALGLINKKRKIDCIYVFDRDDITWCKENMKFDYPILYIENDTNMAEFLTLMKSCKNFVMANSSLSWWSAWLSNNKEKVVVCPKKWFGDSKIDTLDLIPPEWIRI